MAKEFAVVLTMVAGASLAVMEACSATDPRPPPAAESASPVGFAAGGGTGSAGALAPGAGGAGSGDDTSGGEGGVTDDTLTSGGINGAAGGSSGTSVPSASGSSGTDTGQLPSPNPNPDPTPGVPGVDSGTP